MGSHPSKSGGKHSGKHAQEHKEDSPDLDPPDFDLTDHKDLTDHTDHADHTDHTDHTDMPLFKKKSKEDSSKKESSSAKKKTGDGKKRLQHQMYLAKESPEPVFDISRCELTEVPAGVYSLCKVLQKQTLLLNNNWLTSLKGGGCLRDLAQIRILDVSENELTTLPDDLDLLRGLQVLVAGGNRLKTLPAALSRLSQLQTLNCRGNRLKEVPTSVCSLPSLRTLDLSLNPGLRSLPRDLCRVKTLESLTVDTDNITYPPHDILQAGTASTMEFLCGESGVPYEPPSRTLLPVLDPPVAPTSPTTVSPPHDRANVVPDLNSVSEAVLQYEAQKDRKRREHLELEQRLDAEQRATAELASSAAASKTHLIQYMAQDQERVQGELSALQQQKDRERQTLVNAVYNAEQQAGSLLARLVEMGEKARRTEETLEQLEAENRQREEWWKVRAEEVSALRKKEVLAAMERVLEESAAFSRVWDSYEQSKNANAARSKQAADDQEWKLSHVLTNQQDQQARFVQHLLTEERLQKSAFEALQCQRDARHRRLTGHIGLIQQQLAQLSTLEVEQRQLKVNATMDVLAEKRLTLTRLLMQLLEERELREKELHKRLAELEDQREADQTDYWLVQYQRLMDKKPQALIDQESELEFAVRDLLRAAGADTHLPTFARHRVTMETMYTLTDADLAQMGVHEVGLRKSILKHIDFYREKRDDEAVRMKAKKLDEPYEERWLVRPPGPSRPLTLDTTLPSAPPRSREVTPTAVATPPEVTAHYNTECVICLDKPSSVLFLLCGHVCCCGVCSDPLAECPLCRGRIVSRIRLQPDQIPPGEGEGEGR